MSIQNIGLFSLFFIAALLLLVPGCSSERKYATFEDCLLENIRGSETEAAAIVITNACKGKFPPSKEALAAEQVAIADAAAAAENAASEAEAAMAPLLKEHLEAEKAARAATDAFADSPELTPDT